MPTEDSHPQPPEEYDPDKTLFFQRRRKTVAFGPLVIVCVLVLGSGALVVWAVNQPAKPAVEEITDAPYQAPTAKVEYAPRALPVSTLAPVAPVDNSANSEPAPALPDANAPLNLDVKDPGNAQVRADVLRRIDLMPGVSAANKDKLYASVDHARSMGRVLTIPFVKGETAVRAADVERLRVQLDSPQIRPMADDPTVVFVILGYADPKGSDKINADLSHSRARNVMDALRDRCGLQNVMHAVAMGGSTLFSTQQTDKNRVVEVWAVVP